MMTHDDYDEYYDWQDEERLDRFFERPSRHELERARLERARQAQAEEYRQRSIPPTDWNDQRAVRDWVHFLIDEDMMGRLLPMHFLDLLRDKQIAMLDAIQILKAIPRREERIFKKCLEHFICYRDPRDATHEEQVVVMNEYRILQAICKSSRRVFRMLRDAVLENGDFRKLGVVWAMVSGHLDDVLKARDFLDKAVTTHSLECIQELGDGTVDEADQSLFDRIERGIGPTKDCSELTTEFLAGCHILKTGALRPEEKVRLASEMALLLVGRQSRQSREVGLDLSLRTQHTKLRTLNYLLNIVFGQMTRENAGVMLRWTMLRHRHHKWVWDRLMREVKKVHGWRMLKVEQSEKTGEIGVAWEVRRHLNIVLPTEDSVEQFGSFEPGQTVVLLPPVPLLGRPVEQRSSWTVYQHPLHPMRPPTPAMKAAIDEG